MYCGGLLNKLGDQRKAVVQGVVTPKRSWKIGDILAVFGKIKDIGIVQG
ncbi:MAG: hypothetical protein M3Q97_04895 [Bacteroidota bacterium]|nr:hypothetical protein [Bacteroidota bacterium]